SRDINTGVAVTKRGVQRHLPRLPQSEQDRSQEGIHPDAGFERRVIEEEVLMLFVRQTSEQKSAGRQPSHEDRQHRARTLKSRTEDEGRLACPGDLVDQASGAREKK